MIKAIKNSTFWYNVKDKHSYGQGRGDKRPTEAERNTELSVNLLLTLIPASGRRKKVVQ